MTKSRARFWVKIGWILAIIVIFLGGYGLALASHAWVSGQLTATSTKQFGFPLPWETLYPTACPTGIEFDCFEFGVALSSFNFALDWAFYSAVGYGLLAFSTFGRRLLIRGHNRKNFVTPTESKTHDEAVSLEQFMSEGS